MTDNIPKKIELSASDPFLKYLAFLRNNGVDYMQQSSDILKNMVDYYSKLDEFMRNNKLNDYLDDMSQNTASSTAPEQG